MPLQARTVTVDTIDPRQLEAMLDLMTRYYQNVARDCFTSDLTAKRWVILLEDEGGLRGFSTQTVFEHRLEGRKLLIFYSGDTIIDRSFWGSTALPMAFARLVLTEAEKYPDREPYWLLTTKGHRTYRFLPVYFRTFFPSTQARTPAFEARLIADIGRTLFGHRFDPARGILRACADDQRLRPEHADVPLRQARDPHVAFFLKVNPGYGQGDELVCIASFRRNNLIDYVLDRVA
jgi:hypothetical protein